MKVNKLAKSTYQREVMKGRLGGRVKGRPLLQNWGDAGMGGPLRSNEATRLLDIQEGRDLIEDVRVRKSQGQSRAHRANPLARLVLVPREGGGKFAHEKRGKGEQNKKWIAGSKLPLPPVPSSFQFAERAGSLLLSSSPAKTTTTSTGLLLGL